MKKKITVLVGTALFIAGCTSPAPYNIPVEDRSDRTGMTQRPAAAPEAPPSGVIVQPIEGIPVFRPQQQGQPLDDSRVQPPVESGSVPVSANPAVVALLDSARSDVGQGDLRSAQSRLERALRIAPRDPEIYFELADVQRQQGQYVQAEQVALRGVEVAEGQSLQLRRLWVLISLIRGDVGDQAGADRARQEASRY
ncbi:tetratricopeptide repeat protein [Nitrincola alkalilacustris]|uniref:tetratricopeptide repeat protein n=1 Tax=Nitrincola alkalilacustris TaxID=1571224 RepID=UPI00124C5D35|nr:tetratricopeptide repeat protein [Nitrincola alkalilacustris]